VKKRPTLPATRVTISGKARRLTRALSVVLMMLDISPLHALRGDPYCCAAQFHDIYIRSIWRPTSDGETPQPCTIVMGLFILC
jgi:hypothetical protein